MNKSPEEIFNEKISLIYEFDKRSPVFVRVANTEIENNNVDKAIEILNTGLKSYFDYPTAYILLGKAYTLLGNYSLALKHYKKGSELIYAPQTLSYYVSEIDSIKQQRSFLDMSKRGQFYNEEENINQVDLFDDEEKIKSGIDDRLEELAVKISSVRMEASAPSKNVEEKFEKVEEHHVIISETLARIYEAQGEYKEAITVYSKLLKKHPDKVEDFTKRINEIKQKLED